MNQTDCATPIFEAYSRLFLTVFCVFYKKTDPGRLFCDVSSAFENSYVPLVQNTGFRLFVIIVKYTCVEKFE